MSEIEKMYENAGVKADRIVCYRGFDNCMDNDFNCHCHNEKPCKDATKIYPPFTAEKQIELCKWLIKNYRRYVFDVIEADSFETDLAKFMNEEWQDLTETEQEEIKEILK